MLTNFSREKLTVPKATVLGVAEEVSADLVDKINAEKVLDADSSKNRRGNERTNYCESVITGKVGPFETRRKTSY